MTESQRELLRLPGRSRSTPRCVPPARLHRPWGGSIPLAGALLAVSFLFPLPVSEAIGLAADAGATVNVETDAVGASKVTIGIGDKRFHALYQEALSERIRGGVIILPDLDGHPDRSGVIRVLRTGLPNFGWSTLALPLPEPDTEPMHMASWSQQMAERLPAAIEFLAQHKVLWSALISDRSGSWPALDYLSKAPGGGLRAAVFMDFPSPRETAESPPLPWEQTWAGLTLAVFDVVSDSAPPPTARVAQQRRLLQKGNPRYRQLLLDNPNHRTQGMEDMLLNRIHGWLVRMQEPSVDGGNETRAEDKRPQESCKACVSARGATPD